MHSPENLLIDYERSEKGLRLALPKIMDDLKTRWYGTEITKSQQRKHSCLQLLLEELCGYSVVGGGHGEICVGGKSSCAEARTSGSSPCSRRPQRRG